MRNSSGLRAALSANVPGQKRASGTLACHRKGPQPQVRSSWVATFGVRRRSLSTRGQTIRRSAQPSGTASRQAIYVLPARGPSNSAFPRAQPRAVAFAPPAALGVTDARGSGQLGRVTAVGGRSPGCSIRTRDPNQWAGWIKRNHPCCQNLRGSRRFGRLWVRVSRSHVPNIGMAGNSPAVPLLGYRRTCHTTPT